MRFVCRWRQAATDDLAEIWLDADSANRYRITAAAREVDRLLQRDPDVEGESRDGDRRILFVAPLVITYRVDAWANKAEVLRVRQIH